MLDSKEVIEQFQDQVVIQNDCIHHLLKLVRQLREEDWEDYYSCCSNGDHIEDWAWDKKDIEKKKEAWDMETGRMINDWGECKGMSAAEIMKKAGIPNMLEERPLHINTFSDKQ